jgi:hypothetical protein
MEELVRRLKNRVPCVHVAEFAHSSDLFVLPGSITTH